MPDKMRYFATVLGVLAVAVVTACSSGNATPSPTPAAQLPSPTAEVPSPTSPIAMMGSGDGMASTQGQGQRQGPGAQLSATVISTDLSVGHNRVAFALLDSEFEPVNLAQVQVTTSLTPTGHAREVATAVFRPWPLGNLGVYTTQLTFDQAGTWALSVATTMSDGSIGSAMDSFTVREDSSTPAIGSQAPPSVTKTVGNVGDLRELTSANPPNPDLYSVTIADALELGKPLVVVFATPAFCTTATCGPQVEVIEGIKEGYEDRVTFIHVEMFDNPHEIQGDLRVARVAPAVLEWGLLTEPWTFVVDGRGLIVAKFEAFTTAPEIESELEILVGSRSVRGTIADVEAESITSFRSLTVQDEAGTLWTFRSEGFVGFTPSHLREHQAFALPITVRYMETPEGLLALGASD